MFHDGWMWGWHWLWWIFWIAIFVMAVFLIVRAIDGNRGSRRGQETALDVLERRYAAGEISTDEYQERKANLSS